MEMIPQNQKMFSIRIVSMDYYMSPPISDLDICYSSFHGKHVVEVPVIRIYGSTLGGQKTCLHIHRAFPYLYIDCSDVHLQDHHEGHAFTLAICSGIEKAYKLNYGGLEKMHVHGCHLVRGKKFYGYHPSEELFLKIYLYYPHDVSRVAAMLQGGSILNRVFQPHESHIPYLLQFLVDYNLYGMGHILVSDMKFRLPIPDNFIPRRARYREYKRDNVKEFTYGDISFLTDTTSELCDIPIWTSSRIPNDWIWTLPGNSNDVLVDPSHVFLKRQSTCELEGDVSVNDILNKEFQLFTSFSQTKSDVKMVQSLVPIWDEHGRAEENDVMRPPVPGKPLLENVLRSLNDGAKFQDALETFCAEHRDWRQSPLLDKNDTFIQSIKYFTEKDELLEIENAVPCEVVPQSKFAEDSEENSSLPLGLSLVEGGTCSACFSQKHEVDSTMANDKEILSSAMPEAECSSEKDLDAEALELLRWLASSQVVEDLNSDDELLHEAILSPLLPGTSMEKVLEKAQMDFECETKQDCDDILDSVNEVPDFMESEDNHSYLDNHGQLIGKKRYSVIPQFDSSCDDRISNSSSFKKSETEKYGDCEKTALSSGINDVALVDQDEKQSFPNNASFLGTFPIQVVSARSSLSSVRSTEVETPRPGGVSTVHSMDRGESSKHEDPSQRSLAANKYSSEDKRLNACSARDLMRRKRLYHVESSLHGKHMTVNTLECNDETMMLPSKQHSNEVINRSNQEMQTFDGVAKLYLELENPNTSQLENVRNVDDCIDSIECCPSEPNNWICENIGEKEVEMAFIQKPPSIDQNDEILGHNSFSLHVDYHAALAQKSFHVDSEDVPPFFVRDFGGIEGYKALPEFPNFMTRRVLGVATHCENDGSLLYLLTSAYSPPSFDSVHDWLFPVSQRNSVPNVEDVNCIHEGSMQVPKDATLEDASIGGPTVFSVMKSNREIGSRDDISQLSGPDVKSTSLSQLGFRDPAHFGAGQQLTLLSLEILADSRGDLRPNPEFDAVNIIALVFQDDDSHEVEVFALVCNYKSESSGRNVDGLSGCKVISFTKEEHMLHYFINTVCFLDPDILIGWEVQSSSLGFLAERSAKLGISLLRSISRTPVAETKPEIFEYDTGATEQKLLSETPIAESTNIQDQVIVDEWGRTHASGLHVGGRIILNIWRIMRAEVRLSMYSIEAVTEEVLRRKVPSIPHNILTQWFSSGQGLGRFLCIDYVIKRAKLNLEIMNQLDMINRTSELARVFGIDFFSVLSRGSQYRVESMLQRLAHTQNYIAISPGRQQVASQPAMECLPLVMEPESGFYSDPVVVLDFQSLYPSMVIAYNLCFCTCLGNIMSSKSKVLGVSSYSPNPSLIMDLKDELLVTPNGVMYVPKKVRKGVLPHLLEEILCTRILVKQTMKKLKPSQQVLHRVFNARQLALKLIANVTYGYTAAGFSGRMPCAELADSIVQCGRKTLEKAISFVNSYDKWNARVIYGDTDSLFVLLKGKSMEESFQIGQEIASSVTAMNPHPVTLKMEKVYHPCFLLTKKRYVGYSYENPKQRTPTFDAKGIETIRRDTCGVVAKTMERSLKIFFECLDISKVREYLQRQWARILSEKVSLRDFVFSKEVRLGTYSSRGFSLPPAAIVASKASEVDPRAEPHYGERVPYVVIHGEPGMRLRDMVVNPLILLELNSPHRLNDIYYIKKQMIPALQRIYGLLGADLTKWFSEIPHPVRPSLAKRKYYQGKHKMSRVYNEMGISKRFQSSRTRIDYFYISKHCILCGELVEASNTLCNMCSKNGLVVVASIVGKTSKMEREILHLSEICGHCGGVDYTMESGVKCTSLACPVFYERRKVQKELHVLSSVATEAGFYPPCFVEWF